MILEALVTTISPSGAINLAPMGPRVDAELRHLLLRPFRTSQTYRNLKAHGEGVVHVTDDVWLLAKAALGPVEPPPALRPAEKVRGWVLQDCCRYFEFRVLTIDDREERAAIETEIVHAGWVRDFFGLNRAKHAVVEAAILATRTDFLPLTEIEAEYRKLAVLIEKTGGPAEREAFHFLRQHLEQQVAWAHAARGVTVQAPSRLHFGLFNLASPDAWPNAEGQACVPARQFGGVGLMVQRPGICLTARPAADWGATGPLAERALRYAQTLANHQANNIYPHHLTITTAPPEHIGLGTGTQLALTVARALWPPAQRLGSADCLPKVIQELQRGARSAVGIHGFLHGGFLVDGGKGSSAPVVAPLLARVPFPEDWRIVLVMPRQLQGLHGAGERDAFQRLLTAASVPPTDTLCRLVLLGMVPALMEQDVQAFGEALYDFNRRVGAMFAPVQGGPYAHPLLAEVVSFIRQQGIAGVGQSSWGPTIFATVADEETADHLVQTIQRRFHLAETEVMWTAACNAGAQICPSPDA